MIYRLEHSIPKTKDEKTIDGLSRSDYASGDARNILFVRASSEQEARRTAAKNSYPDYCNIWLQESTTCDLYNTEGEPEILQ